MIYWIQVKTQKKTYRAKDLQVVKGKTINIINFTKQKHNAHQFANREEAENLVQYMNDNDDSRFQTREVSVVNVEEKYRTTV